MVSKHFFYSRIYLCFITFYSYFLGYVPSCRGFVPTVRGFVPILRDFVPNLTLRGLVTVRSLRGFVPKSYS